MVTEAWCLPSPSLHYQNLGLLAFCGLLHCSNQQSLDSKVGVGVGWIKSQFWGLILK